MPLLCIAPNDRPGIALIGCGGMRRNDANSASRFGDILAVCDVDEDRAAAAARQFTKDGKVPAQLTDSRKVLERQDIQIILQATPDHWHTMVNLAAAASKRDIYGAKPLTLTIDEGKRMVKAVGAVPSPLAVPRDDCRRGPLDVQLDVAKALTRVERAVSVPRSRNTRRAE